MNFLQKKTFFLNFLYFQVTFESRNHLNFFYSLKKQKRNLCSDDFFAQHNCSYFSPPQYRRG